MNYHNLTYPDQNNGDGLRVVLWLSGCSHYCRGCQNPQTWDENSGIKFDKKAEQELFNELSKDYISGITLSGGDPLSSYNNLKDLLNLINKIRDRFGNTKTIWLYTGYTWEELFYYDIPRHWGITDLENHQLRQQIALKCDVIVDGRFEKDKLDLSLPYRGSSNQRLIDVNETLKNGVITILDV